MGSCARGTMRRRCCDHRAEIMLQWCRSMWPGRTLRSRHPRCGRCCGCADCAIIWWRPICLPIPLGISCSICSPPGLRIVRFRSQAYVSLRPCRQQPRYAGSGTLPIVVCWIGTPIPRMAEGFSLPCRTSAWTRCFAGFRKAACICSRRSWGRLNYPRARVLMWHAGWRTSRSPAIHNINGLTLPCFPLDSLCSRGNADGSGRLAQLVERLVYTENVGGSSPSSPTTKPA